MVSCFNLYFPDCTDVEYMFMCFDQLELLGELVTCCSHPPYSAVLRQFVCVHTCYVLLLLVLLYTPQYVTSLFTLFMNILNCSVIRLPNRL